jgi:cytochrome c oxidase cbb3-type subunit I/II
MTMEGTGLVNADDATHEETRPGGEGVVRIHFTVAVVFLALAVSAGTLAAIQLIWPEVGYGIAFLSYGRVTAMATNLFLYGWLTLGFLAGAYFVLPRVSGRSFVGQGLARVSAFLIGAATAAGTIGIAFGLADGRPYLSAPLVQEILLLGGLVLAAAVVTRNVAPSSGRLVPAQWYLLASSWWAVLTVIVGLVPGVAGLGGAMQIGFYRAAMGGLWFIAAGVGLLYYLVPRLVRRASFEGSTLSVLGFWSFAIAGASIGPAMFIYGPIPGWLQSVGVAFSIGLFVPVLVIVADLAIAMRGRRSLVDDRVTLSFLSAGTFLFLLVPVQNIVQALRTSSSVVGLTGWITAGDLLLFGGALSFWLFGFAYHATGSGLRRTESGDWHFGLSTTGIGLAVAAMWMGGVVTGLSWTAGVNASNPTTYGDGWAMVSDVLDPFLTIRMIGIGLFAISQIIFVFVILTASWNEPQQGADVDDEPFDLQLPERSISIGWGRLRWGVVVIFMAVVLVTVAVPTFDPDASASTLLADDARTYPDGSAEATGRAVYVREGCIACHTQSVRPIVPDVGLGPVSVPGDYVNEAPPLVGLERLGPDLMHVGSRIDDVAALQAHLDNARHERPWSIMPSYRYLSQADLDALTEYLLSLR